MLQASQIGVALAKLALHVGGEAQWRCEASICKKKKELKNMHSATYTIPIGPISCHQVECIYTSYSISPSYLQGSCVSSTFISKRQWQADVFRSPGQEARLPEDSMPQVLHDITRHVGNLPKSKQFFTWLWINKYNK